MKKILFICFGNMCRSPMAEYLCRKIYKDKFEVDSAGLIKNKRISQGTLQILKEMGIDASNHKPKVVNKEMMKKFDLIIAMDSYVFNELTKIAPELKNKIRCWGIEDPYLCGMEIFRKVAFQILEKLKNMKENI